MDDLPKIDLILQSHNHWDHLDIINLPKIYARDKPLIVTSLGVSQFLKQHGIDRTIDMDWWDEYTFKKDNFTEASIGRRFFCFRRRRVSGYLGKKKIDHRLD